MPPPRKRPHPRSLDALFGRPKPAPKKRCPGGHLQPVRWRSGDPCLECKAIEARRAREQDARDEKARFRELMGPVPLVLRVLTLDTQKVTTYAITPRQAAERRARDKRRGRRRGARI
jgi:hypothetical protein